MEQPVKRPAWSVQYCGACGRWAWHTQQDHWYWECGTCHHRFDRLSGPKYSNDSDYFSSIPNQYLLDGMTAICHLLNIGDGEWEIVKYSEMPVGPHKGQARYGLFVPGHLWGRVYTLVCDAHLIASHAAARFAANERIQVHSMRKLREWRERRSARQAQGGQT